MGVHAARYLMPYQKRPICVRLGSEEGEELLFLLFWQRVRSRFDFGQRRHTLNLAFQQIQRPLVRFLGDALAHLLPFNRPRKTRDSMAFSNVLKIPIRWPFFHAKKLCPARETSPREPRYRYWWIVAPDVQRQCNLVRGFASILLSTGCGSFRARPKIFTRAVPKFYHVKSIRYEQIKFSLQCEDAARFGKTEEYRSYKRKKRIC